jgi:hypothetical protein
MSLSILGFLLPVAKGIYMSISTTVITTKTSTRMELNVHLTPTDCEPIEDPTRYHHIIGSLIYLGVTRHDISYSVHILS